MHSRVKKQMAIAKKKGMSPVELLRMREIARKEAEKMENEATEKALLYMLAIPLNVLVSDYWPKSAKKRAPKFVEDVLSLYKSVEAGVVTDRQLADLLEEYAHMEVRAVWLAAKGE
jgi:hypothetical protein